MTPIAVIGMSCRVAGCAGLDELWDCVRSGRVNLTLRPLDHYLAQAARRPAHQPLALRGWLDQPASSAPALYGISSGEQEEMSPQHALVMESVWQAFENGAVRPGAEPRTAVYLACNDDPEWRWDCGASLLKRINFRSEFLATRIAWSLDLRGEALQVSTACSSALVAVHLAMKALAEGRCAMAVVAASSVDLRPRASQEHPAGMVSARWCRPFDADADGMIEADGAGAVVLKRLDDALGQGDPIHAVLLASDVNNDGRGRAGYLAPGVEGQAAVIAGAIEAAGIDPRRIAHVEAHGTGTELGDPIEWRALRRAFTRVGRGARPCGVGSVKANVGHCIHASGLLGLIQACLFISHRHWVGQAAFDRPSPHLELAGTELFVRRKSEAMAPGDLCGVSSFGIGGTNAHVLVGPPPQSAAADYEVPGDGSPWRVAPLSAASSEHLTCYRQRLAQALRTSFPPLPALVRALRGGLLPMACRQAVVARTVPELAAALEGSGPEVPERVREAARAWEERGELPTMDEAQDLGAGTRCHLPPRPIDPLPVPPRLALLSTERVRLRLPSAVALPSACYFAPFWTGLQEAPDEIGDEELPIAETTAVLKHVVAQVLKSRPPLDCRLVDLNVDSLQVLDLLERLEATFGVRLAVRQADSSTLGDLRNELARALSASGSQDFRRWRYELAIGEECAELVIEARELGQHPIPEKARALRIAQRG